MECLQGVRLLGFSRTPHHLRAFLEPRPDRLAARSEIHKSIVVLRGAIGSNLQMTPRPSNSPWPMLRRTGKYPPSMVVPELDNVVSVSPDEQRIGCNFLDHVQAAKFLARISVKVGRLHPGATAVAQAWRDNPWLKRLLMYMPKGHQKAPVPAALLQAATILTERYFHVGRTQHQDQERFLAELAQSLDTHVKDEQRTVGSWDRAVRTLAAGLACGTHADEAVRHIERLEDRDELRHIVLQGCGDVSMNSWHICYVGGKEPRLIHVPGEPLDDREYSCLISWEDSVDGDLAEKLARYSDHVFSTGAGLTPGISIGRLRINQYGSGDRVRLNLSEEAIEVDRFVRFAVYGKPLAWGGKVLQARRIAREFSDVRHLLALPNMNPPSNQASPEQLIDDWGNARNRALELGFQDLMGPHITSMFQQQPRYMFGVLAEHDVWLAERVLVESDVLLQSACEHAIEIPLSELGASWDWITVCLMRNGYEFKKHRETVTEPGEFTWDTIDPANKRLVVFFGQAIYPCTLVGIGRLGGNWAPDDSQAAGSDDLFLLAWGHEFAKMDQKYSVFDCARYLVDLGAQAVLLMDEGRDVFQFVFDSFRDLKTYEEGPNDSGGRSFPVPAARDREQMRATLSFWTEPTQAVPSGRKPR